MQIMYHTKPKVGRSFKSGDIGFNGVFYNGKHEFINNTVMSNKIITFSGAPGEGGGVKIDGQSQGAFVWLFNNIIGDNKNVTTFLA